MEKFELSPIDGRTSFYGKAYYTIDPAGNKTLYSYNTAILTLYKDGTMKRLYSGYTATTGRHIKAFCGLDKKTFLAMEVDS